MKVIETSQPVVSFCFIGTWENIHSTSSFEMKEEGGGMRGAGLVNPGWSLWNAAEDIIFLG